MKKYLVSVTVLIIVTVFNSYGQSITESALLRHVQVLTSDTLAGRKSGSVGETKSSQYINKILKESGVTLLYPSEGQDFSYVSPNGDTVHSRNIVGIIEGYDKTLKEEFILVGAHFDHLGFNSLKINGKEATQIYRGADDNASGVACMLEIAKMVAAQQFLFKRSIIFVAFGAEESGMNGSWYFANRAFGQIDNVKYMINLDMVGRSGGDNFPRAYTVIPNIELSDIFKLLTNKTLTISPKFFNTDYFPSDHQPFCSKGIPVTLFTTGLHRDYHTSRDIPELMDYKQMEGICDYIFNLILAVSDKDKALRKTVLSKEYQKDDKNIIYSLSEVQKRPSYIHGDEKQFLKRWVYSYLKYPEKAIKEGIQGRVIIEFVVEKTGEVSSVQVIESVDMLLDDEALRVVKASPKWKPATINGTPVRTKISVPIEFRLKR